MHRKLMLSVLAGILVFCNVNSFAVRAEDEHEFSAEVDIQDESSDIDEIRSAKDSDLTGEAYAVLTSTGDLTFFRSENTYTNGTYTKAVDINGIGYTGTVYSGIETKNYRYMEDAQWYGKTVKRVKVASGQTIRPINTAYWFNDQMDITSIDLTGLDTGNVTDMKGMFMWCQSLTSLKLTGLDTSNVTEMQLMFSNCYALKTVDVSGFNTAKVVNMSGMFAECAALTALDLSSFDTQNVTNMASMFTGCSNLTDLNISSFNTGKVTSMADMFYECSKLKALDLRGFDTRNVTNMQMMFYCCSSLTSLDLSAFDTRSVTSMSTMFGGTQNIKTVKLGTGFTKWIDKAVLIGPMWINREAGVYKTREELCEQYPSHATEWAGTWEQISVPEAYAVLTDEGDLVFFLSSNSYANGDRINAEDIFGHTYTGTVYSGIETLAANNSESVPWNAKKQSIISVRVADGQTISPVSMSYWFYECSGLKNADLKGFDTSNATDMSYMFTDCTSLTGINLTGLNTGNVTMMTSMFAGCRSLRSLDLSSFDTAGISDMNNMFLEMKALQEVKLGPGFTVWKNDSYLPEGSWVNKEKGLKLSETELYTQYPENADVMAGTWEKELPSEAYAVLTDNGELVFIRSHNTYENNAKTTAEDINGNTYTGIVYSGIENTAGMELPWNNDLKQIKEVISFEDQMIYPDTLQGWFYDCSNLIRTDFSGFNTENTTDMSSMFSGCSRLTALDLSTFNTMNVTDMNSMFSSCERLTDVNLSSFKTDNVTDLSNLFFECQALKKLDLSSFDTSKVTNMESMFYSCSSLNDLNIGSFRTSDLKRADRMFNACASMSELDLAHFNTSNVISMAGMFSGCKKLEKLNISSFDTSKVTTLDFMFEGCESLKELDLSHFNTSNVMSMSFMFSGCIKLKKINLSSFDTSKVSVMNSMFKGCTSLFSLDLTSFDTAKVESMYDMFVAMPALMEIRFGPRFMNWIDNSYLPEGLWMNDELNLSLSETELYVQYPLNFRQWAGTWHKDPHTYAVLNEEGELIFFRSYEMFESSAGEKITVSDLQGNEYYGLLFTDVESIRQPEIPWDYKRDLIRRVRVAEGQIIKPISLAYWFSDCENLTEVDMTGFDTENVRDMKCLFAQCPQLKTLDLSMLSTENVEDMSYLFSGCTGLESINIKGIDTSNVTTMYSMFSTCFSLKRLDLSEFRTEKVTDMDYMFQQCLNLEQLDLSSFNTSNVTSMTAMFSGCEKLNELDVSIFDTSGVRKMGEMFASCKCLVSLDLTSFETSEVTTMDSMFYECTALEELNLSSFNTSSVTDMNQMFDKTESLRYIHLGPEFTVWDVYTYLPEGKWTNHEINVTLTEDQLREQYPANAKKWAGVWEFNGRAYAVLQNDGEFVFFRSCYTYENTEKAEAVDVNGNQYNGTVFSGIENDPTIQEEDVYWASVKDQIRTVRVAEGQMIEPQGLYYWFSGCKELTVVNLTGMDLSACVGMEALFSGCEKLETADLGDSDISEVSTTGAMFKDCISLKELDLSSFDTGSIERMEEMFTGSALEKITLGPKFTKWLDDSCLPKGFWQNSQLGLTLTEKELYEQYPSNAEEWAGEWIKKPDSESIMIYGSSLALEGKIEINFFLDIPETVIDQLTVVMSLNGNETRVSAVNGTDRVVNNHQLKVFTCTAAAKEMRDQIILTLEDSEGHHVPMIKDDTDYSEGYAYSAADYFVRAEEAGQEKTRKLTRVMNNYGKYTQIYFNYKVTDEVKDVKDVSAVTLESLDPYKAIMTAKGITGLTYVGGSAMLDDAIGYRLYFNLESGHDISEYTFTIDNTPVTPVLSSGTQYYIEKKNIAAKDLGIMNTILITGGTEMMAVRYSGLSYAYTALSRTGTDKAKLQNMCRAMYLYNQQAIEYFNN